MKPQILKHNSVYQDQVETLLRKLAAYDDATLNNLPATGGWSAIQVAHHLILTEELSLKYVRKKLSFNPKLEKAAGLGFWFRLQILKLYLGAPFRFKAPDAVGDQSLPGFSSLADTRVRWMNIRQEWTSFLEQLPNELAGKAVYRHPFAGRFGWPAMLVFFRYHFNRHLKQIERTLKNNS